MPQLKREVAAMQFDAASSRLVHNKSTRLVKLVNAFCCSYLSLTALVDLVLTFRQHIVLTEELPKRTQVHGDLVDLADGALASRAGQDSNTGLSGCRVLPRTFLYLSYQS
jgi:hypothetical protein